MLDMIRKHTVEGSGNWRSICTMVERAREMMQMTKQATRGFVSLAVSMIQDSIRTDGIKLSGAARECT